MLVHEDFYYYESGIYHHAYGNLLAAHAIAIVGWGIEEDQKYWLIRNSWGADWGEGGYFRILRGWNECSVEMHAYATLFE